MWGSPAEVETHRRMRLLIAAFAYERLNISIMSDHEFDMECLKVDLSIDTGNPRWDSWWRDNFDPSTGQWVHRHPDINGLHRHTLKVLELKGIPLVS